jgi:hypothetical protein
MKIEIPKLEQLGYDGDVNFDIHVNDELIGYGQLNFDLDITINDDKFSEEEEEEIVNEVHNLIEENNIYQRVYG